MNDMGGFILIINFCIYNNSIILYSALYNINKNLITLTLFIQVL